VALDSDCVEGLAPEKNSAKKRLDRVANLVNITSAMLISAPQTVILVVVVAGDAVGAC